MTPKEVNSYNDIETMARMTVLYAMENIPSPDCFFEPQSRHSIFYKVYNDLCNTRAVHYGSYFAIHLKDKYDITIPHG